MQYTSYVIVSLMGIIYCTLTVKKNFDDFCLLHLGRSELVRMKMMLRGVILKTNKPGAFV